MQDDLWTKFKLLLWTPTDQLLVDHLQKLWDHANEAKKGMLGFSLSRLSGRKHEVLIYRLHHEANSTAYKWVGVKGTSLERLIELTHIQEMAAKLQGVKDRLDGLRSDYKKVMSGSLGYSPFIDDAAYARAVNQLEHVASIYQNTFFATAEEVRKLPERLSSDRYNH